MRPFIISVLLLIHIASPGQVERRDTVNTFRNLNIALVLGSSIVLQDGIINVEESKSFMTFYNEKGQPVEERIATINDKGAIIYRYTYGNCRDYQSWEWLQTKDGDIDTVHIQQVTFNGHCKIDKITWADSTGRVTSTRYFEFDSKGKQMRELDKDTAGKITSYVLYHYPDSFTVDKKAFFGDSAFWYHTLERFDRKGNRTSTLSFDEKGNKSSEQRTEFFYKGDNLVEEVIYDSDSTVVSRINYYYAADNLLDRMVSKSSEGNSERETITVYKYRKKD
jgi:hypothetical protein